MRKVSLCYTPTTSTTTTTAAFICVAQLGFETNEGEPCWEPCGGSGEAETVAILWQNAGSKTPDASCAFCGYDGLCCKKGGEGRFNLVAKRYSSACEGLGTDEKIYKCVKNPNSAKGVKTNPSAPTSFVQKSAFLEVFSQKRRKRINDEADKRRGEEVVLPPHLVCSPDQVATSSCSSTRTSKKSSSVQQTLLRQAALQQAEEDLDASVLQADLDFSDWEEEEEEEEEDTRETGRVNLPGNGAAENSPPRFLEDLQTHR